MADPVIEQTSTTTTKASTEESAAAVLSPPSPIPSDDGIRRQIAWAVIVSEGVIVLVTLYLWFFESKMLPESTLSVVSTLAGSILGYKARDTGTVIGYLFGGSSGGTSSRAALEKKV